MLQESLLISLVLYRVREMVVRHRCLVMWMQSHTGTKCPIHAVEVGVVYLKMTSGPIFIILMLVSLYSEIRTTTRKHI